MKEFRNVKAGKLKPSALIDQETPERHLDFESFLLVLALIFNDIKGILQFFELMREYGRPNQGVATEHAGEYGGLQNQLNRFLIGIIHEALVCVEKNPAHVKDPRFLKLLDSLHGRSREVWDIFVGVATNDAGVTKAGSDLAKLLAQIRNNAAFHYYQAGVNLTRGYRRHFYTGNEEGSAYDFAYFSAKKTEPMLTRFYYADAAVQGYILDKLDSLEKSPDEFFRAVIEFSAIISRSILDLLVKYLESKPRA